MKRLFEKYQVWWRDQLPQLWVGFCILIAIAVYFKGLSTYEGVQILLMITLVLVTWRYAQETAEIRKANVATVERMRLQSERPYIVGLVKSAIKPLEAELDKLINKHEKREFEWKHTEERVLRAVKFEIKKLELLRCDGRYYIPWPLLIISGLFGQVPNDSDISYYAYLLERNSHLKELIDQYNPEAEKLWAQLCELAVVLAKSDLRRALQGSLTTRRREFNLSDEEFSKFKQTAQEYCLYLASSKLLMKSQAYDELMAINWGGYKESATWSFWQKWQDNLMQNVVTDKSIKQLQASILKKSETLANHARTIKDVLLRIKKEYMRQYNILPEEIEPTAYII